MRDYIPALARSCWRAGDRSGADPDSRLGKNSTNKIWRYTTIGAGEPVDRLQVSHCHPPQTLIYGGLQSLRINYIAVNIEPRRPADWSWHFCRLTLHNTAPRSILLNVISSLFWFLFLRTLRHGAGNSSRTLQRANMSMKCLLQDSIILAPHWIVASLNYFEELVGSYGSRD